MKDTEIKAYVIMDVDPATGQGWPAAVRLTRAAAQEVAKEKANRAVVKFISTKEPRETRLDRRASLKGAEINGDQADQPAQAARIPIAI